MAFERLDTLEKGPQRFREAEEALKEAGFLYFPWEEKLKLHKLTNNKASDEKGSTSFFVVDREDETIALLEEYSPFFKAFSDYVPYLWRIYSKRNDKDTIRKLIFDNIGGKEGKNS